MAVVRLFALFLASCRFGRCYDFFTSFFAQCRWVCSLRKLIVASSMFDIRTIASVNHLNITVFIFGNDSSFCLSTSSICRFSEQLPCKTFIFLYNRRQSEVDPMDIHINDILMMKKPHPCGCNAFIITRIGMDFKLRCESCGHEVMIPRSKAQKNIKSIEKAKG